MTPSMWLVTALALGVNLLLLVLALAAIVCALRLLAGVRR